MTKLQTESLSNIRAVRTILSFPRGHVLHILVILSTTDLCSCFLFSIAAAAYTRASLYQDQDRDGGAGQAWKISHAHSLSILIAGRHSIFVQASRGTNSKWKLEQRRHGATAWMVMKAALDYAAWSTYALRLCTAIIIIACTVNRRVHILEELRQE